MINPLILDDRAEVVIHHKTGIILPLILDEIKRLKLKEESKGEVS